MSVYKKLLTVPFFLILCPLFNEISYGSDYGTCYYINGILYRSTPYYVYEKCALTRYGRSSKISKRFLYRVFFRSLIDIVKLGKSDVSEKINVYYKNSRNYDVWRYASRDMNMDIDYGLYPKDFIYKMLAKEGFIDNYATENGLYKLRKKYLENIITSLNSPNNHWYKTVDPMKKMVNKAAEAYDDLIMEIVIDGYKLPLSLIPSKKKGKQDLNIIIDNASFKTWGAKRKKISTSDWLNKNFPNSTFLDSCIDVEVTGNLLTAECKNEAGYYKCPYLDTSKCELKSSISNQNGHLVCSNKNKENEEACLATLEKNKENFLNLEKNTVNHYLMSIAGYLQNLNDINLLYQPTIETKSLIGAVYKKYLSFGNWYLDLPHLNLKADNKGTIIWHNKENQVLLNKLSNSSMPAVYMVRYGIYTLSFDKDGILTTIEKGAYKEQYSYIKINGKFAIKKIALYDEKNNLLIDTFHFKYNDKGLQINSLESGKDINIKSNLKNGSYQDITEIIENKNLKTSFSYEFDYKNSGDYLINIINDLGFKTEYVITNFNIGDNSYPYKKSTTIRSINKILLNQKEVSYKLRTNGKCEVEKFKTTYSKFSNNRINEKSISSVFFDTSTQLVSKIAINNNFMLNGSSLFKLNFSKTGEEAAKLKVSNRDNQLDKTYILDKNNSINLENRVFQTRINGSPIKIINDENKAEVLINNEYVKKTYDDLGFIKSFSSNISNESNKYYNSVSLKKGQLTISNNKAIITSNNPLAIDFITVQDRGAGNKKKYNFNSLNKQFRSILKEKDSRLNCLNLIDTNDLNAVENTQKSQDDNNSKIYYKVAALIASVVIDYTVKYRFFDRGNNDQANVANSRLNFYMALTRFFILSSTMYFTGELSGEGLLYKSVMTLFANAAIFIDGSGIDNAMLKETTGLFLSLSENTLWRLSSTDPEVKRRSTVQKIIEGAGFGIVGYTIDRALCKPYAERYQSSISTAGCYFLRGSLQGFWLVLIDALFKYQKKDQDFYQYLSKKTYKELGNILLMGSASTFIFTPLRLYTSSPVASSFSGMSSAYFSYFL